MTAPQNIRPCRNVNDMQLPEIMQGFLLTHV